MEYLAVTICIFFLIIGLSYEEKKINALTIFSGLWGIIIFLSSICLYNLNKAKNSTYVLLTLGILSFGIGYIFFRIFFSQKFFRKKRDIKVYIPKYKFLYILSAVTILFYLKDLMLILNDVISNGRSLEYIRLLAQDTNSILYTSRSNIENFIRMMIILPFVMVLQPVVAIDFICGKKNKTLLILNIIILVLRSLTDGSRVMFIYFIMHLILVFMFSGDNYYKNIMKKNKNKIIMIMVLVVGIFFVYKTSVSRSGENTLKNMYYYYSIEPYMFEQWKEEVDNRNVIAYGSASTNGFIFPTIYTIKNIFGLDNYPEKWYKNVFLLINETDKDWKVITSGTTKANAYVSIFWFFYLDGKIIGIIIGSLLYSMIIAYSYSKLKVEMNNKNLCIYLLLLQGVLFSYVRMQFSNETYAISILYALFLVYKKNKYGEKKNEIEQ